VFIDDMVDRNGPVFFRCHVDETLHQPALEILDWMFDSAWSTVCLVEAPIVVCDALRNLKVLLASGSNHDPMVKDAQSFEGGTDATDTESTAISIGTVLSIHSDPPVDSNAIRGEAENDPVTVPIVPPALGESTRPSEGGQP